MTSDELRKPWLQVRYRECILSSGKAGVATYGTISMLVVRWIDVLPLMTVSCTYALCAGLSEALELSLNVMQVRKISFALTRHPGHALA